MVPAYLLMSALTCVFVDHGLLRLGEAEKVVSLFRGHYNIPLVHVDAAGQFLSALAGISELEDKRKAIGRVFIEVFEAEAKKLGGAKFLAQGERAARRLRHGKAAERRGADQPRSERPTPS
jgi:GMP synthase PP-ATPase subunit